VYVAVSGASLAVMMGLFVRAQGVQGSISAASYTEELTASINANMAYSSSSFSAYVPKGLCGATVVKGVLITGFGNFTLDSPLIMGSNALCPGQGVEKFGLVEEYNGTYLLQAVT
jgi:hypothetical protein